MRLGLGFIFLKLFSGIQEGKTITVSFRNKEVFLCHGPESQTQKIPAGGPRV
jgi:hypothetical protein